MSLVNNQPIENEAMISNQAPSFPNLKEMKAKLRRADEWFKSEHHDFAKLEVGIKECESIANEIGTEIENYFNSRNVGSTELPPESYAVYLEYINLSIQIYKMRSLQRMDNRALVSLISNLGTMLENYDASKTDVAISAYISGASTNEGASESLLSRYEKQPKMTFADIIGEDELKTKIIGNLELSKYNLSGDGYKSILLYGPAGTGKTSFIEAIANYIGAKYIPITNADLFLPTLGAAETLLSNLFAESEQYKRPVLLFFDEIDTITGRDGHELTASITATFLHWMSRTKLSNHIFAAAATNFIDRIDPAILRRFRPSYLVGLPAPEIILSILRNKFPIIQLVSDSFTKDLLKILEGKSQSAVVGIIGIVEEKIKIKVISSKYFTASRGVAIINMQPLETPGYAPSREGTRLEIGSNLEKLVWPVKEDELRNYFVEANRGYEVET